MTEILKIDYNNEYALEHDFDLNSLRKLHRIKGDKGSRRLDLDESDELKVIFGARIEHDPEKAEKLDIKEMEASRDQYSKWWSEGNRKAEKLQGEIKCLKQQIEELTAAKKEEF